MNKVLIVAPYYWPALLGGGGQVSIENMIFYLKNDFKITVLCNHSDKSYENGIDFFYLKENVEIIYFKPSNFFKCLSFIVNRDFKIIYLNSFFSPLCILTNFILYFNKKSYKIISPKGELYDGALSNNKLLKSSWILLYKFFFRKHFFHATSLQELLLLNKIFPKSNIKLARDIPSKFENMEIEFSDNSIFKIVFCSSIVPKKNIEFLISVLNQVKSQVVLDIWGQAFDNNYLTSVLDKLEKLPENIVWQYNGALPFSESKNIFKSYDLFLFPTLGENYGHVIYESLSCGCPVLLSKGTTPWDALENYGAGYNISLLQIDEWIDKLNFFIKMPKADRLNQRKSCIKFINEEFNIESIIEENQNLFNI